MSFGLQRIAPLLPEFLASYPEITIDLHLGDEIVDLVGEGFDAALRIAALPDSSLLARRLCSVEMLLVAAPSYLTKHGRPAHPDALSEHACFSYAYLLAPGAWRFTRTDGAVASVKPRGSLRANNGEALLPSVLAGLGIALLPDFIVADALAAGTLEIVLPKWSEPESALHWVTPPGGPKPARIEALAEFFANRLSRRPLLAKGPSRRTPISKPT